MFVTRPITTNYVHGPFSQSYTLVCGLGVRKNGGKKEQKTNFDVTGLQDGDGESIGRRMVAQRDVHFTGRRCR